MIAAPLVLLAALPLIDFLDDLERRAVRTLESIRHASTPEEAAAARPALRRQLEIALGRNQMPWPPKHLPQLRWRLRLQRRPRYPCPCRDR